MNTLLERFFGPFWSLRLKWWLTQQLRIKTNQWDRQQLAALCVAMEKAIELFGPIPRLYLHLCNTAVTFVGNGIKGQEVECDIKNGAMIRYTKTSRVKVLTLIILTTVGLELPAKAKLINIFFETILEVPLDKFDRITLMVAEEFLHAAQAERGEIPPGMYDIGIETEAKYSERRYEANALKARFQLLAAVRPEKWAHAWELICQHKARGYTFVWS